MFTLNIVEHPKDGTIEGQQTSSMKLNNKYEVYLAQSWWQSD